MFGNTTSGLEMMLRNMGLASVLDAAKTLAESGAVQKIILFADQLEELNGRLDRIEATLGIARGTVANYLIEGTADVRDDASVHGRADVPDPDASLRDAG